MAADFEYAFQIILDHEGRQCEDVPGDPGGLTAYGITFASAQAFWGADKVDRNFMLNLTEADARSFYLDRWSHNFDHIEDTFIGTKVFDGHVNMGANAIKCAQRACGVEDDGTLGPQTIAAINARSPDAFMEAIKEQLELFYNDLVARKPLRKKFLRGWLRRAACKVNGPCEISDHKH